MKGSAKKDVTYKIDQDYKTYEYAVSNEIADMINEYKILVKDHKDSILDSLFKDEIYVEKNCETDFGFFHSRHFSMVLEHFYCDVIEKYYQKEVIIKDKLQETSTSGEGYKLQPNEIVRITLGDSRHIAMQNMLLNGCNILMAKEITGHDSANMIYHYSGNMKMLIKCRAYRLFEMSKRKDDIIMPLVDKSKNFIMSRDAVTEFVEVDQGKCHSKLFIQGDMRDCYAVSGSCFNCKYLSDKNILNDVIEKQGKEVKKRIERLKKWICSEKEYRNMNEYNVLTNQLKACVENLENAYIEKMKEEDVYDQ